MLVMQVMKCAGTAGGSPIPLTGGGRLWIHRARSMRGGSGGACLGFIGCARGCLEAQRIIESRIDMGHAASR